MDLDENRLKAWIEILQTALKMGYSSSSLPADVLLDVMIDGCLQLRNQSQAEGLWSSRSNATLEFLERPLKLKSGGFSGVWSTIPDSLGNVGQKRRQPRPEKMTNPALPKFFDELAQLLVNVKRTHQVPQNLYSCVHEDRRHKPSKISPETFWYLKRRQGRLRENRQRQP